jgi:hypothetical protein
MDFPKVKAGRYAVVRAEVSTGIVLRDDTKRYTGTGEIWQVFESLSAAHEFAAAEIAAHTTVECDIYDSERRHIATVRNEKDIG